MRPQNVNDKPPPDFREQVTNDIIKLLETGTAPWQKPWEDTGGGMPMNPTTGKSYRGGNVIALMVSEMQHGFSDARWMTYRQASEKGWQVRKGEKGSRIEFWEAKPGHKTDDSSEEDSRLRLIHRTYVVFNAQQIDGIPPLSIPVRKPFEVIQAAEDIVSATGAKIRHGGSKAYFSPQRDCIQMPDRSCFVDEPHYYATLFHELAHWAEAKKRLGIADDKAPFGSPEYAKGEIRADMASLFLSAELGIPFDPADQAGYIDNWIRVLKNDKNEVFRAASDASKICDFVLGRPMSHEVIPDGKWQSQVTAGAATAQRSLP